MRRPRLNVLRTFEAAGRRLSFSLAAADLNISQAAVSQQMRHLEAHLGAALFLRHHRRVSLTPVGQKYLEEVHGALERLDEATDKLFAGRVGQAVSIRCTTSVATLWLAPQIRAFQTQNPGIDLTIKTQDLDAGPGQAKDADFEIFVSDRTDFGPDVRRLLSATITPVGAPGYLAQHQIRSAQDIQNLDMIHIFGYRDNWQRWMQVFGVTPLENTPGLAVDSSLFAIDAALRGDGVFLGQRPFIDTYLSSGELVEMFDKPHHLNATYYLRHKTSIRKNSSKDKVLEWLLGL